MWTKLIIAIESSINSMWTKRFGRYKRILNAGISLSSDDEKQLYTDRSTVRSDHDSIIRSDQDPGDRPKNFDGLKYVLR